tara:strand:- start:818 stop:1489 length:672 start_codon:yes stop_codon:yes gene_type:complete
MLKNNDIDIFLMREDLLNIFHELIVQFDNSKEFNNIRFNIINKLIKNNISPITILDEISAQEMVNNNFPLNNYILIIGEIRDITREYLANNYINYECIDCPILFLNLVNKCQNLINQVNSSILERVNFLNFSYSFQLNTIYTDKHSLYLTDKENEIFKLLIDNNENTLSKKQLLSKVWNYNEDIDTHTLETHIYTLRKKIKKKLNLSNLIDHEEYGYRINQKI